MVQVQKKPKTKRLNLRALFEDRKPIWVANTTGTENSRYGRSGNVILQVGQGNQTDRLTIPPGGDPVCLSDQVDYDSLKSCNDLFKSLRAETLELLDPEKAEEYYSKHEGRRDAVNKKMDDLMSEARTSDSPKEEVSSSVVSVNPRVTDICLRLKHKAITEREALERLIESEGMFGLDDYNYLFTNGRKKSIKKWAKEKMLDSATEDDDDESLDD
jgi:hypothetical protein